MARYTASALVLGVHNWGDADKIVTLFTRERGLIRAAAFGARRPKSPLAAGLQMFNEIEAELTEGQRLDTVRTASLLHHPKKLSEDLDNTWAVVAEAIQTILRREGYPHPYEALKALTRTNTKMTEQTIHEFVETLNVSESVKQELRAITPHNYTGM